MSYICACGQNAKNSCINKSCKSCCSKINCEVHKVKISTENFLCGCGQQSKKFCTQNSCRLCCSDPKCLINFSIKMRFCASFTSSTACKIFRFKPYSPAVRDRACTSFGKHEPPYPVPAYKKP